MQHIELWQFLAGLGFFLYGMNMLESVLKNISGRRLKFFLKRNTQNIFKAIFGGTIVTAIVQSSTVVSLIVLAFVEAGIVHFRNALAVILGANLGTTATSWIVTFVGFKLDILDYALPVIAITAIGMFFLKSRKKLHGILVVFFALGILFMGLDNMKQGALVLVKDFDLAVFSAYNALFFVLIGFVLTAIIQSSSATVAITLTAVYVEAITLPAAAAVVIGSEVGTTITILLWGMKGSPGKKRVAWGHFIYNIFTSIVAFFSLGYLLYFFKNILQVHDPLISLVMFQTSINILAITLFIPLLHSFSNWLERTFHSQDPFSNIHKVQHLPLLAVEQMREAVGQLFDRVVQFNRGILCHSGEEDESLFTNIKSFAAESLDSEQEYDSLKHFEGAVLSQYAKTREFNFDEEDTEQLLHYAQAARACIYSAKAVKDIGHNMREIEGSISNAFYRQRDIVKREWRHFDEALTTMLQQLVDGETLNTEVKIDDERFHYEEKVSELINLMQRGELTEVEASTLMNVYREILSSKKSLLRALNHMGFVYSHET